RSRRTRNLVCYLVSQGEASSWHTQACSEFGQPSSHRARNAGAAVVCRHCARAAAGPPSEGVSAPASDRAIPRNTTDFSTVYRGGPVWGTVFAVAEVRATFLADVAPRSHFRRWRDCNPTVWKPLLLRSTQLRVLFFSITCSICLAARWSWLLLYYFTSPHKQRL